MAIHGGALHGPASAFPALTPGGEGEGSASASPLRALPLPTAARQTQPLEPILFPRLRIRFADFPYLHCSIN